MVPIEGGSPTKLADGSSVAVSPDGGSIAFTAQVNGVPSLVVCSLPGCSSPRTIGAAQFRHGGLLDPGRSRRRLRERRESVGAAAQRWRSASAHTLHRRPPDPILCVVARRAATGHHAIDRHQRHRAVRGLELEALDGRHMPCSCSESAARRSRVFSRICAHADVPSRRITSCRG